MPKKIVFFNYYHNGDIHVSRGLVRQVMNKVHQLDSSVQFSYTHKNYSGLLYDVPQLGFEAGALSIINNDHVGVLTVGDTIYFNTWYGQQNFKFMNRWGLTFDALYSAFDENCKLIWGFSLEDISTDAHVFFPTIDYDQFPIGNAKNWLSEHPGKKIFISNGAILSDQAKHFALGPIINDLAKSYQNITFIVSNKEDGVAAGNIVDASDIIRKTGNDLNENSFLASNCDMIIGKASGSFTFAMTQDNYFNKDIKILAFCNLVPVHPNNQFWIGELLRDKIKYRAEVIVNNSDTTDHILSVIKSKL